MPDFTDADGSIEGATAGIEADVASLAADPEMAAVFIAEALDHLGTIEATLLRLESAPEEVTLLDDVFRPFHTIKGNAGALGVMTVEALAHTVENLLDRARAGHHRMGPAEFDIVLKTVDLLTAYMRELSARVAGGGGIDPEPRLLELMRLVDTVVKRGAASGQTPSGGAEADCQGGAETAGREGAGLAVNPPPDSEGQAPRRDERATVKVDTRKLDTLVDMVNELVVLQSIIEQDPALRRVVGERVARRFGELRRITIDLQRSVMSMRMVSLRQTFQKVARLVRDLSRKSGKPVELVLSGEDTEIDRRVVEHINDPLMHMVRNSLAHGLEPAGVRTAAGKRAQGRLSLSACHRGSTIVIAIADDGAGLNTEKIRAKAIARKLVAPDAALSLAEIHRLIFEPGFSTADTVTEMSGRGVGMDVVRRNIEALRGRIEIQSERGAGTTFLITLPLTLAGVTGPIDRSEREAARAA
jgi:two-component system chemotaxis sensor kinase CheA